MTSLEIRKLLERIYTSDINYDQVRKEFRYNSETCLISVIEKVKLLEGIKIKSCKSEEEFRYLSYYMVEWSLGRNLRLYVKLCPFAPLAKIFWIDRYNDKHNNKELKLEDKSVLNSPVKSRNLSVEVLSGNLPIILKEMKINILEDWDFLQEEIPKEWRTANSPDWLRAQDYVIIEYCIFPDFW